jgi:hypothetical protein
MSPGNTPHQARSKFRVTPKNPYQGFLNRCDTVVCGQNVQQKILPSSQISGPEYMPESFNVTNTPQHLALAGNRQPVYSRNSRWCSPAQKPVAFSATDHRECHFNLFNHPELGMPINDINEPGFGSVSSTVNNPRLIQLAQKLSFQDVGAHRRSAESHWQRPSPPVIR